MALMLDSPRRARAWSVGLWGLGRTERAYAGCKTGFRSSVLPGPRTPYNPAPHLADSVLLDWLHGHSDWARIQRCMSTAADKRTRLANNLLVVIDLPSDMVIVTLIYWRAMASAQWLPLTIALSRLGDHPVSVHGPATSKLAIGLRWMGRCNFVPGLSERTALGIVRRWIGPSMHPGRSSLNDLSMSGMSPTTLASGRVCASCSSVVIREKLVRSNVAAVMSTE